MANTNTQAEVHNRQRPSVSAATGRTIGTRRNPVPDLDVRGLNVNTPDDLNQFISVAPSVGNDIQVDTNSTRSGQGNTANVDNDQQGTTGAQQPPIQLRSQQIPTQAGPSNSTFAYTFPQQATPYGFMPQFGFMPPVPPYIPTNVFTSSHPQMYPSTVRDNVDDWQAEVQRRVNEEVQRQMMSFYMYQQYQMPPPAPQQSVPPPQGPVNPPPPQEVPPVNPAAPAPAE